VLVGTAACEREWREKKAQQEILVEQFSWDQLERESTDRERGCSCHRWPFVLLLTDRERKKHWEARTLLSTA
jgi:hypothetical protein